MIWPAARRFLLRSDGAAAIEFALIAPVALILLGGLVDVGLWVREKSKVNQVTRDVAQAAMYTRNTDVLRALLDKSLNEHGIVTNQKNVTCLCPGDKKPKCEDLDLAKCATSSALWEIVIEVDVAAPYQPIFSWWSLESPASRVQVQIR